VLKLIDRFPYIIYAGGALLGYVAGEMLVSEALFATLVEAQHYLHWLVPVCGAVLVLAMGKWLSARKGVESVAVNLVDESINAKPINKVQK
jgi:predicted tellurium resistance membrane protein TerC